MSFQSETVLSSGATPSARIGTIDEVIQALDSIIESSIATNSRIGYFAALYRKVTVRVKDGISKGEFEDPLRMEKFDVLFASRYLTAIRQWAHNEDPTSPWVVAMTTTGKLFPLVLQHLLLAMNAHINLDLGIAAVELSRRSNCDLQTLRKDFMGINNILAMLTLEVSNQISRVSPLLSLFGLHTSNTSLLIQFSLSNARDGSWNFAEELNAKEGADYDNCILKRCESIEKLARAIINTRGLIRITMFLIYLFEWKIPRKIIKVLHRSPQKTYVRFS